MTGSDQETAGYETVILTSPDGGDELWQVSWVTPEIAQAFAKYVRGRVWNSARRDLKDQIITLSEYEGQVSMLRRQADTDYAWHPPLGGKQVMGDGILEYMRDPMGRLYLMRLFLQEHHRDVVNGMTDEDLQDLAKRDDEQWSNAMLICAGLKSPNSPTPEKEMAPGEQRTKGSSKTLTRVT